MVPTVETMETWQDLDCNGRPQVVVQDALNVIKQHYAGFVGDGKLMRVVRELDSERDRNFLLETASASARYVLKISNVEESREALQLQHACFAHLERRGVRGVPRVVRSDDGGDGVVEVHIAGQRSLCRLFHYVDGETLASIVEREPYNATRNAQLWANVGERLGDVSAGLESFREEGSVRTVERRTHIWDVQGGERVVRDYVHHVKDDKRKSLVMRTMARFASFARKFDVSHLRKGYIYGDCNDHNVIIDNGEVVAFIDYGDMVHSYTAGEVAIAAAYASMHPKRTDNVVSVLQAYDSRFGLTGPEVCLLLPLVCLRLCMSCVISARNETRDSENAYLQDSSSGRWQALAFFDTLEADRALQMLKAGFGNRGVSDAGSTPECSVMRGRACSDVCSAWEETFRQCWNATPGYHAKAASLCGGDDAKSSAAEIRRRRDLVLGKNLSLMYDEEAIQVERGSGCHLYDGSGTEYLDSVNNVPHVGHSNPVVSEAVSMAMLTLNTNTRYIRNDIVEYAEDIVSLLPEALEVVYFCNSGSEANDLAVRISREIAKPGMTDIVVMDGAYHGHTIACTEISPYKFNRKGGKGRPTTTHIMPCPDVYRGKHLDGAKESDKVLKGMARSNRKACAFICESLLSCGGQVILPEGYLKAVYKKMRACGALCIADEVQCGFGRVGTHFWGFESQGVVPDMVVLGKSIGNGFPLAMVVTTRKIADAFSTGVEYFNTYGGCNAACAAGMAVLKVVKKERLQRKALKVGSYFRDALEQLLSPFPFVGEVRGTGLFLGIEFVIDRERKLFAPNVAKFVKQSMKRRRILCSTDGMHSNVIKIKPPMTFGYSDVDRYVKTLRDVLLEDLHERALQKLLHLDASYNDELESSKHRGGHTLVRLWSMMGDQTLGSTIPVAAFAFVCGVALSRCYH